MYLSALKITSNLAQVLIAIFIGALKEIKQFIRAGGGKFTKMYGCKNAVK